MSKNDGGPVFPSTRYEQTGTLSDTGVVKDESPVFGEVKHSGMTLRDYFAGKALPIAWDAKDKGYFEGDNSDVAECAYQMADAMLKARDD